MRFGIGFSIIYHRTNTGSKSLYSEGTKARTMSSMLVVTSYVLTLSVINQSKLFIFFEVPSSNSNSVSIWINEAQIIMLRYFRVLSSLQITFLEFSLATHFNLSNESKFQATI